MTLTPAIALFIILAQAGSQVTGAGLEGSLVGAVSIIGILGGVLAWLFFYHLPAKDAQINTLIASHVKQMEDKDARLQAVVTAMIATHARQLEDKDVKLQAVVTAMIATAKEAREENQAARREVRVEFLEALKQQQASFREALDQLDARAESIERRTELMDRRAEQSNAATVAVLIELTKRLEGMETHRDGNDAAMWGYLDKLGTRVDRLDETVQTGRRPGGRRKTDPPTVGEEGEQQT